MIIWMELAAILALACTAGYTGKRLAVLPGPWWHLIYGLSIGGIIGCAVGRRVEALSVVPPISWMLHHRLELIIMAVAIPVLCQLLLARLASSRLYYPVLVLMYIAVGCFVVPAYVGPAALQYQFATMENRYDDNQVCQQRTAFTCGPAAAVTALERLGFEAREGELATLARTSNLSGTDEGILAYAIAQRYPLKAGVMHWGSVKELAAHDGVIVIVRYSAFADHYVAVLEVTEDEVVIGDPSGGRVVHSHAAFMALAKRLAVTLDREVHHAG